MHGDGGLALSFDDDFIADWHALLPLLAQHQVRATFFVKEFDRLDGAALSQLRAIAAAGHEVGCHGLRHRSVLWDFKRDPARVAEWVDTEIKPAVAAMRERGFAPASFAYPFGHHAPAYDAAVLGHFRQVRVTSYRNRFMPPKWMGSIYCRPGARVHGALGIDGNYKVGDAQIEAVLDRARDTGRVALLYAHQPADDGRPYTVTRARLAHVLGAAQQRGLRFLRIGDLP